MASNKTASSVYPHGGIADDRPTPAQSLETRGGSRGPWPFLLLLVAATLPLQVQAQAPPLCNADIVLMLDRTGSISAGDRSIEGTAADNMLTFLAGATVPPRVAIGAFGDTVDGGLEAFIVHALTSTEAPPPYGDNDGATDGDLYHAVDTATGSSSSVGTNLADAISVGQLEIDNNGTTGVGAIIMISDGDPSEPGSTTGRELAYQASDAAKLSGTEIFNIHLGSDPAGFAGPELLAAMSSGTEPPPATDSHDTDGHQNGSANDGADATAENNDGDHFFVATSASQLGDILETIAGQFCVSLPTPVATPTASLAHTATPAQTATDIPTDTPAPLPTDTATPLPTDTAPPAPTATEVGAVCGDNNIAPSEQCDDGNDIDNDGCDADCTISGNCSLLPPQGAAELFVNDDTADGNDPGCSTPAFATIQEAIDAAADGDTIRVCPGTYVESLTVHAEITLRSTDGSASTTIDGGDAPALDLRRSGTTIAGFTLVSTGITIDANAVCPLAAPACALPGEHGSNLTITVNVIEGAHTGIDWRGKIDCAAITGNSFYDNVQHVLLRQEHLVATPAVLVEIASNTFDGGGSSGIGVEVYGMQAQMLLNRVSDAAATGVRIGGAVIRWASGVVENSGGTGILVENAPAGTQVLESEIWNNVGDGITIGTGGSPARVLNNNIQGNAVGLRNLDTSGVLDATLNYWDSFTGPFRAVERPFGLGDSIVDAGGADTLFIEFLCDRFPQGFPSAEGTCGTESSTLLQLTPGSWPDMTAGKGRFIAFESPANLDIDPRTAASNPENTSEAFLLDRIPPRRIGGTCLGDLLQTPCKTKRDCPGINVGNGLILEGSCGLFSQLSDTGDPSSFVQHVRLSRVARIIAFDRHVPDGVDPNDGGAMQWIKRTFERISPAAALSPITPGNDGLSQRAQPNLGGRKLVIESNENLTGENSDGNWEIFSFDSRRQQWRQLTHTLAPVDNRRPILRTGLRTVFDSTGDLDNDPKTTLTNPDGNREIFSIKVSTKRGATIILSQLSDTQPPVENILGCTAGGGRRAFFSSNGNMDNDSSTTAQNTDGNREIFGYTGRARAKTFTQLTDSVGGESTNPACTSNGAWVAFESTADLEQDGATNRRIYTVEVRNKTLLRLSRSRYGDNAHPRTTGRFVVWDSNANLTGANPAAERVIYLFDRRKDRAASNHALGSEG